MVCQVRTKRLNVLLSINLELSIMSLSLINKRSFLLLIFILAIISMVGVITYMSKQVNINFMDDFTCKAKVRIERNAIKFSGVVDIKVLKGKGSLRIDGVAEDVENDHYTIQRTVLFNAIKENSNPTWKSREIITTHLDNIPDDITSLLLPMFYIKPTTVTNIELESLNDGTLLITKSHLPYLYCSGI